MSEKEFQELMQAGHGRAIVYAQEHGVSRFRNVILDGCLRCYAVDRQCEGTRADYMTALVKLTPDPAFYCNRVLASLPEGDDDWDTTQRFHFATSMALEGDVRARRAVYDNFEPGPTQGEIIALNLLRLDGLQGFLVAAAKMGALLQRWPNEVDSGWLWSQAVEDFGEEEALAVLRTRAATNPDVAVYLTAVEAEPNRNGSSPFQTARTARAASAEELESAAWELLRAETLNDQIRHLRLFCDREFPLEPSRLLELARSRNGTLAYAACGAVARVRHPAVRKFAIELVTGRMHGRSRAINMLCRNFEPGDHELVLRWFVNERDRKVRHWMGSTLQEFWKKHPDPASEVRMLLLLYDRAPCSFCREKTVQQLIELGALSPAMRRECAFDANEDIQNLVLPLL